MSHATAAPAPAATFTQEALDASRPAAPSHGLGVGFKGLYATLDDGEVVHAIVEDAIEFEDQFGEPVTHERALELARSSNVAGHLLHAAWCVAVCDAEDDARAEAEAERRYGGEG